MTDAVTVQPAIVCAGCNANRTLYTTGFHAPGPDRVHERCAHVRAFMLKRPDVRFEAVFTAEAGATKWMRDNSKRKLGVERVCGGKMPRDLWVVVEL